MTNFSNTGAIPLGHFYCPGTIQARELLAAWTEHDNAEIIHDLLFLFQWFFRKQYRRASIRLCEARSNIAYWRGHSW